MFHILGFLFIIVIAVIIIGLALVGSVLRAVFGLGKRSPCQVQIVTDPIIIQEAEDITTKLRLMIKKKSSLGQEPSTKNCLMITKENT